MSAPQFFPIPARMLAIASETVSRRVSRLPFLRDGVKVTPGLVGVTMECLNAEFTKALPLTTPREGLAGAIAGLDRSLEQRTGRQGKIIVPVVVDVLIGAGIAEPTEISDRHAHLQRKGIRLLGPWTWHTGTGAGPGEGNTAEGLSAERPESWMSICPVCKSGILNKISGKQLFGIPRTDFIIECTFCGAKFIPVGSQYRLVSIAVIRDPLWKKHLDKTYSPDVWAGFARGPATGVKTRSLPVAGTGPVNHVSSGTGRGTLHLKKMPDGSLAIPIGGKTLYFHPLRLKFGGRTKEELFVRSQKSLSEILLVPSFAHLQEKVNAKYYRYLSLPLGLFLGQLKERYDPFYREFLNPFGDERYCSFRLAETSDTGKGGVMITVAGNEMYFATGVPDSFANAVNNRLGRVTADDCLLCGDPVKCRINALFCTGRNEAGLFIHEVREEPEQDRITKILNAHLSSDGP